MFVLNFVFVFQGNRTIKDDLSKQPTFKKYVEDGPIPSRLKGLLQGESSGIVTPRQIASILGHKDVESLLCTAEEQIVLKP